MWKFLKKKRQILRHIYLIVASVFLLVLNFKKIVKPRSENNTLLLVKYGNLGDIYITIDQLKKFELDNSIYQITIAVPKMYSSLVKAYFPNQEVLNLPNLRTGSFYLFLNELVAISLRSFSTLLLLGGSASPIQEDLCVVFASAQNKIRVYPDSSKGNVFTRIVSRWFYDKCIKLEILLEADIIFEQLALFFEKIPVQFSKSNNTVSTDHNKCVLICPGASLRERRWTVETLIGVINQIKSLDIAVSITILGSKIDGEDYAELTSFFISNKINVQFDNYKLSDLEAKIISAEIIITNDAAPMHIARMYRCPMIVVSGQGHVNRFVGETNFGLTKLACRDCNWHCKYDQIGKSFPCVEILGNKEQLNEFRELFRRTFKSIC